MVHILQVPRFGCQNQFCHSFGQINYPHYCSMLLYSHFFVTVIPWCSRELNHQTRRWREFGSVVLQPTGFCARTIASTGSTNRRSWTQRYPSKWLPKNGGSLHFCGFLTMGDPQATIGFNTKILKWSLMTWMIWGYSGYSHFRKPSKWCLNMGKLFLSTDG